MICIRLTPADRAFAVVGAVALAAAPLALAGLLYSIAFQPERWGNRLLAVPALVGLSAFLAWLVVPRAVGRPRFQVPLIEETDGHDLRHAGGRGGRRGGDPADRPLRDRVAPPRRPAAAEADRDAEVGPVTVRVVGVFRNLLREEEVIEAEHEVGEILAEARGPLALPGPDLIDDIAAATACHARPLHGRPMTEDEFAEAVHDLVSTALLVAAERAVWMQPGGGGDERQ